MKPQKNFHVPLSEDLYQALRTEAERSKRPATVLAREAIQTWVKEREREKTRREIAAYAEAVAGTVDDLDEDLEAAALELWDDLP